MISEEEVLESLDKFGDKIKQLRQENEELKAFAEKLSSDHADEWAKQQEVITNLREQLEQPSSDPRYEGAMKVIHHVVEDTIEGKYEPLVEKLQTENRILGERAMQLQTDKNSLLDKVNELKADIEKLKGDVDRKDKMLEAVNNRLKSFSKAPSSDLDIDSMITRIHNSEVETSEVDNKLNEIKNERFTNQYEWGRATKETELKFVDFVERLWSGHQIVNNYRILNHISNVRGDLDDNTMNTFVRYLLDVGLIQKRDNGEVITTYDLSYTIARITKVC